MTALIVGRIAGLVTGKGMESIAAATFLLWPDFLLATPLTSHDVHGYLWLSLCLLLVAEIIAHCDQRTVSDSGKLKHCIKQSLFAVLLGLSICLLEWTRGFGVFFVLT
ncbi:MAG: hypothetical protein ACKPJJ_07640, partial [Planctomycetaceae bacterium]